jgi:hypothetical protein
MFYSVDAEENKYGYCPECAAPGELRERRPNGNDVCKNGHKYPSLKAISREEAEKIKNEEDKN